ncbi:hypothetical protein [Antarcticirhabdus aurantiaca]|uniref:Uncharacterized protein n=1 Tax=Antarcticirhabdus aurantiaca TaxID=2606717 RepID=A0ACD4NK81_9HYPH|nr:hypothetical protein [Antarcticirhabdus aurantiaca]WAJ27152.1 hypothetical protein OXU80_20180 [Jeongeuplla avenae]
MPLIESFDPDAPPVVRSVLPNDAIERGAMAIYGVVTGAKTPERAAEAWDRRAREITRKRHRLEAEACLMAAGWRPRR